MPFDERTDWRDTPSAPPPPGSTPVHASDILRWERGIAEAHEELGDKLSKADADATYAPTVDVLTEALFPLQKRLLNAANERVDILYMGDSIGEGMGASSRNTRSVALIRDKLRAAYPSGAAGGAGYLPVKYNHASFTSPWVVAGGAYVGQAGGLGIRAAQLTAGMTATATVRCTSFDLHFFSKYASAGTISIDGGTPVAFSYGNGTGDSRAFVWKSGPLADTDHTIVVTQTSGAPYLAGAQFYRGDENKGVHVWDGSWAGAETRTFTGTRGAGTTTVDWSWFIKDGILAPHLVVLATLVNDCITRTATQYGADMQELITIVRGRTAAPILLMPHWEPSERTPLSPWPEYMAQLRRLAATNADVNFFDMSSRVPRQSGGAPNPITVDGVHPNDLGYRIKAGYELAAVLPPANTIAATSGSGTPASVDEIILAPNMMALSLGTTASLSSFSGVAVWKLPANEVCRVGGIFTMPPGWNSFQVVARWLNWGPETGDVVWRYDEDVIELGTVLGSTAFTGATAPAAGQGIVKETVVTTRTAAPGSSVSVAVVRNTASANDTLEQLVGLVSLHLRKAS